MLLYWAMLLILKKQFKYILSKNRTMEENTSITRVTKIVKIVEQYIIKTLIGLMTLLLVLATIQLGYFVIKNIIQSQAFIIDLDVLMDMFGIFLLVLIGIELLDTIKVYFKKHDIHVEVVLLVAMIAISRKVILMDFANYSAMEVMSIAAVIIALSIGYYFIKKSGGCGFYSSDKIKDVKIEEKQFDRDGKTKVAERTKKLKEKPSDSLKEPSFKPKRKGSTNKLTVKKNKTKRNK